MPTIQTHVYNFLPPDELDDLLRSSQRVTGEPLRISKTLGIEAPILRPGDEFEARRYLRDLQAPMGMRPHWYAAWRRVEPTSFLR